jgi:hypothetical protein
MARPPKTTDTAKTKTFVVQEHHVVFDMNGVRKTAGEKLELTQGQAKHFQKLNAITLDMEELFDEPTTTAAESTDGSPESGAEPQVVRPRKSTL